jgi:hypothetical protein
VEARPCGGQATETHQWARFSYGLQYIANNFSGLTTYGPVNQNGSKALEFKYGYNIVGAVTFTRDERDACFDLSQCEDVVDRRRYDLRQLHQQPARLQWWDLAV